VKKKDGLGDEQGGGNGCHQTALGLEWKNKNKQIHAQPRKGASWEGKPYATDTYPYCM
jgi:hypothetical protein